MEKLARFFKALSDETRLRIILLLAESELCVCDLTFVLNEPESKVSRHLAYLKHVGITESRRVAVWMHYRLKDSQDGLFKAQLDFLRAKLSNMPEFRADREKLLELKEHGGCRALTKLRGARRSEGVIEQKRDASIA
jgi:ArsR family transcriptional regulator